MHFLFFSKVCSVTVFGCSVNFAEKCWYVNLSIYIHPQTLNPQTLMTPFTNPADPLLTIFKEVITGSIPADWRGWTCVCLLRQTHMAISEGSGRSGILIGSVEGVCVFRGL